MADFATPSPPTSVRTPQTPKHGFTDSWEPFSPRKSARISSQKVNSNRTPSPRSATHQPTRSNRKASIFSTPATSPQKKRQPAMDTVRRASGNLTAEGNATAAELLGIGSSKQQQKSSNSLVAPSRGAAMLPTPVKTPRRKLDEASEASVQAVARNLFSSGPDILPSPRQRKPKKYSGLTLDSFTAEDMEVPIEIFTDSRDRVPEVDESVENPFYGDHPEPTIETEPVKRRSTRRKVTVPGEGSQPLDDAIHREDGIVYVFRGKKIFRKFSDGSPENSVGNPEAEAEAEDSIMQSALEGAASPDSKQRMTRSSIKPRLLFPPEEQGVDNAGVSTEDEDEEAVTDIEDHVLADVHEDEAEQGMETPAERVHDFTPDTPKAPQFAPVSPPTTARATRTGKKPAADESPIKRPIKSRSPFDGWRRSKGSAVAHGQKRDAEAVTSSNAPAKRQRA